MSLAQKQTIKGTVAPTQSVRGTMKGIPSLDNTLTKDGYAADAKAVGEALKTKAPISHTEDKNNPHGVTASQAGARPDTWMPSASEIGARPDTWTPTAQEVGARPNTWMPTANDVGAAPSGYGLGGNAIAASNADEINANGYYETGISIAGDINSCIVWHNQHSDAYAEQYAVSIWGNSLGSIIHRIKYTGTWQPWECPNPPMALGVEYRTIERWNGKAVFVKAINAGLMPSNGYTTISLTDLGLYYIPFHVTAWHSGTNERYRSLPNATDSFVIAHGNLSFGTTETFTDDSNAYFIFKYIKD